MSDYDRPFSSSAKDVEKKIWIEETLGASLTGEGSSQRWSNRRWDQDFQASQQLANGIWPSTENLAQAKEQSEETAVSFFSEAPLSDLGATLSEYKKHRLKEKVAQSLPYTPNVLNRHGFSAKEFQQFQENFGRLSLANQQLIQTVLTDPLTPPRTGVDIFSAIVRQDLKALSKLFRVPIQVTRFASVYEGAQYGPLARFLFEAYPPLKRAVLYCVTGLLFLLTSYFFYEQSIIFLYYKRGLSSIEELNFDAALTTFSKASRLLPLEQYYVYYARALSQKYRYQEAEEIYRLSLFVYRNKPHFLWRFSSPHLTVEAYAAHLIHTAQYPQAEQLLVEVSGDKHHPYALLQVKNYVEWGHRIQDRNVIQKATEMLSDLYASQPHIHYLEELLNIYVLLDEQDRVQQLKNIADTLYPNELDPFVTMNYVKYIFQKHLDSLTDQYSFWKAMYYRDTSLSLPTSQELFTAHEQLMTLLERFPHRVDLLYTLFRYLSLFQRDQEAQFILQEILQLLQKKTVLTPEEKGIELFALHMLGITFSKIGQIELAHKYHYYTSRLVEDKLYLQNKAQPILSQDLLILYDYAYYYYTKEKWNIAHALFSLFNIHPAPDESFPYYQTVTNYQLNDYQAALATLPIADIQNETQVFSYTYALGNTLYQLKNYTAAKAHYWIAKLALLEQLDVMEALVSKTVFNHEEFMWIWRLITVYNNLGISTLKGIGFNTTHPDYQEGVRYLISAKQWYQRLLEDVNNLPQMDLIEVQNEEVSSYWVIIEGEKRRQIYDLGTYNLSTILQRNFPSVRIYPELILETQAFVF